MIPKKSQTKQSGTIKQLYIQQISI